jgi:iron-sulfur cluster repair protein YtfE (RIC family)
MIQTTAKPSMQVIIEATKIRDLVEMYPLVMPVLAMHGMDLCCGGEHTVAEAVRLHGLDLPTIAEQIERAIGRGDTRN